MKHAWKALSALFLLVAALAAVGVAMPEHDLLGLGELSWLVVFALALVGLLLAAVGSRGVGRDRHQERAATPVRSSRVARGSATEASAGPPDRRPPSRPPAARSAPPAPPPRERDVRGLDRRSVLVLPFRVVGIDPTVQYVAEGVSSEIRTGVAGLKGLTASGRGSSARLAAGGTAPVDAAHQLGARYVLTGTVAGSGSSVTVEATFLDAATGNKVWSREGTCGLDRISEVQADLVAAVAEALEASGPSEGDLVSPGRRTRVAEAQRTYLQARAALRQGGDELQRAAALFEQAVRADPEFALAHGGQAEARTLLGYHGYMEPGTAFRMAREAAKKALELDDRLPEAWSTIAFVQAFHDWDWERAAASFRRAVEYNPGYLPARHWSAMSRGVAGSPVEWVQESQAAVASDPLAAEAHRHLAWALLGAREYEAAEAASDRSIELDPESALGYWLRGRARMNRDEVESAVPDLIEAARRSKGNPIVLGTLGYARALAGDRARAVEQLQELVAGPARWRWVPPSQLATVQLGLGQTDDALTSLERGVEARDFWVPLTLRRREWDALREDERFQALMDRVGLREIDPSAYARARGLVRD